MSSKIFLLLALILIPLIQTQSAPQVQMVYETYLPNIQPQVYANSAFYQDNIIFNTSSYLLSIIKLPGNCTGTLQVTNNDMVWCLGVSASTNQFSINLLTVQASAVLASYPVSMPPTSANVSGTLQVSGDFLIVILEDSQSVTYISQIVFDSRSQVFVCPGISTQTLTGSQVVSVYVPAGEVVSAFFDANGKPSFATLNCNGSAPVVTPSQLNFTNSGQLVSINGSNALIQISSCYFLGEIADFVVSLGTLPDGSIVFGQRLLPALAVAYNESFILEVDSSKENLIVSFVTLGPTLGFFTIDQIEFGITDDSAYINYIRNSDYIQVLVDQTFFIYDLVTRQIVSVLSGNPPILLANGTVVNVTTFGYFTQDPGQPINFTPIPVQDIYYDPSDSLRIWTLFVPMPLLPQGFPNCTVLEILVNVSSIRTIFYQTCPNSQSQLPAQIKGVDYDSNGNPVIAYRDGLGGLITVSTTSVIGKLTIPLLYQYPTFSINVTNGTGIIIAIKLSSFVLGHFNLSTGVIYETISFQAQIHNAICKLNFQYFVLASSRANETTFAVWDAINLTQVAQVTSNVTLQIFAYQPLVALGVNFSSPSIFSGLVLAKGPQEIYVIDTDGRNTPLNVSLAEDVVQITPNDQNTFFLLSTPIDRINVILFEVEWFSDDIIEI